MLIDENQLKNVKKLLDENFKITKYKKTKSFYENKYRFYENEILIDYKGHELSLDLHISFIQKAKFNINYSIFFQEKKVEHQILALIIQVSNDYFINIEQKILDIYLILRKKEINWNYLQSLIKQFKIKKISYLTFYILKNELNFKVPFKIELKKYEKIILNNMIMTKTFRINQILFFYYTFDEIKDYNKFLNDKLLKIRKNGFQEVIKSLKKIK